MLDLITFRRPQRYIGNEWNVIKKSHFGKIKICISYPDLYEVGMSNLGLRIIYGMLNDFPDVVCERVFMPDIDLVKFIREKKIKLFSLETKTPLDEFEVIGFNFNYELNYTNFLNILYLGGINIEAKNRKNIIVIGGGISNPEPIAEFVDVFFLGEFEEGVDDFIDVLRKFKFKEDRLCALAELEGFYVPKFYSNYFDGSQYRFEKNYRYAKSPIKRVYVKDLNKVYYPLRWLTPHTYIVHDRAQIEIARGCVNRCNFCQARSLFYPYRERSLDKIMEIAKEIYKNSGYENFSFLSLSVLDYSNIETLIDIFVEYFKEKCVGLSLPSLRIDKKILKLYPKLSSLKKTYLTLALETMNKNLREKMNKNIDIEEIFEILNMVSSFKIKHIKIYFMFGFQNENLEDLEAIGRFLREINYRTKLKINVSINIFIPKPFSFWESYPMEDEKILEEKRRIILRSFPFKKNLKISISNIKKSILEALLSRADRRFSSVIYRAFLKGAIFDSYSENFNWKIWEDSINEENLDYSIFLNSNFSNFSWSFISY